MPIQQQGNISKCGDVFLWQETTLSVMHSLGDTNAFNRHKKARHSTNVLALNTKFLFHYPIYSLEFQFPFTANITWLVHHDVHFN